MHVPACEERPSCGMISEVIIGQTLSMKGEDKYDDGADGYHMQSFASQCGVHVVGLKHKTAVTPRRLPTAQA